MTEATNNASGPVAWVPRAALDRLRNGRNNSPTVLTDGPAEFNDTPLYTAPPSAAVVPQCLQHFLDHKFTQLAVFDDGRTPLYLTEEQYNSIRSLLARLNPAPVEQSAMAVPENLREEAARCAFVMRNIGSMGEDEIEGDNVDLRFEDAEGRDSGCDISIVEYAERSADLLESLLAAPTPEPVSPWISVDDRLPDHGEPVQVWCEGSESAGVAWMRSGTWYMPEPQAIGYESITYWAPLLSAPEQPTKEVQ